MRSFVTVTGILLLGILAAPAWAQCDNEPQSTAAAELLTQSSPLTVGEPITHRLSSAHPYLGRAGEAAQLIKQWEIHHPGATYIAPHFSRFELAPGDYVIVRAPDGSRSWRYEGFGKADLGRAGNAGFWGIHIRGDRAIIELHSKSASGYGFDIDTYARGFTAEEMGLPANPLTESLCGTDDSEEAKCYQTSEPQIYDKGRAGARLLMNGSTLCTGWLVGDAGHLMTNNHCIGSSSTAMNTDYEFMAEGATCGTSCVGSLACPGTVEATSATFIQTDFNLDYTLVQLPANVSGTYGFLQLRDTGAVLGERIYSIQHPGGWGKRLVVESTHTDNPGGLCEVDSLVEPVCQGGSTLEVGYYMDTQGGSSGSAVLGYGDHCVVALHHCRGSASCTSSGGDPNRGVPIDAVIASLGGNLPPNALCSSTCGNDVIDPGEVCDGSDLGGETCADQGCTGGGTLTCNASCSGFDTSQCAACPACDDDGVCEFGEDCNTCPGDCVSGSVGAAVCGNGVCEAGNGEDCVSCAADCRGRQTGSNPKCCGDGDGLGPVSCSSPQCNTSGFVCTDVPVTAGEFCCGDLTCDSGEDCGNCALDCSLGGEVCVGGVDEDCDGTIDCADGDCSTDPVCTTCGVRADPCTTDAECCSGSCATWRSQCQ